MTDLTDFEHARFNMIEQQIRPWDVLDADVLELLSVVRREDFVPLAHKALAFADLRIPLLQPAEEALQHGQCMLEPKVEARLLQDLHAAAHDKVLEVGAGSGYMAALLAHRAQRVITLEIAARAGADGARQPAARRHHQRRGARGRRRARAWPAKARSTSSCSAARSPRCRRSCCRSSRSAAGWRPSSASSR